MARIVRWDPFREMVAMRREMDRLMDESVSGDGNWDQFNWELPVDVKETQDGYIVKATLPGVNPDDIQITYNNGMLTIQAQRQAEEENKDEHFLVREQRYGTFGRSINLPTPIDANKIEANYDNGVLTLHLPKTEETKPRRIPIKSGDKMIEAHMTGDKSNK